LSSVWAGTPTEQLTFAPRSTLPSNFVHNRFPDPHAFRISPSGHPNTLQLLPSVLNLTGLDGRSAATPQTFVGRRQEHVEFTMEVSLNFEPKQDQEEAGVTVFLNQAQHFDLGVVALSRDSATQAGFTGTPSNSSGLSKYIRLRTITQFSSNMGAEDLISKPGLLPLANHDLNGIQLQIEAVNNTWYAFRYRTGATPEWTTVGWGSSNEVSGGFTGE